ncbi:MAG: ribonuclease H-like YkuK family protein [bacterium]|nr:ribonuclease H-like YkuK family protein [bacterium]
MDKIINGHFYSPTKGNLKIDGVIEEIINYISEKPEKFYDIIVGCDSSSEEEPHFPVALVVLRVGEGGRFFLKKIAYKGRKFFNWKQRVLEEVFLSCQLALYFKENFEKGIKNSKKENLRYQFRYIHADVGENGKTKDMIKEITGLIKGNGFEPKIKPESFVASTVADRYS